MLALKQDRTHRFILESGQACDRVRTHGSERSAVCRRAVSAWGRLVLCKVREYVEILEPERRVLDVRFVGLSWGCLGISGVFRFRSAVAEAGMSATLGGFTAATGNAVVSGLRQISDFFGCCAPCRKRGKNGRQSGPRLYPGGGGRPGKTRLFYHYTGVHNEWSAVEDENVPTRTLVDPKFKGGDLSGGRMPIDPPNLRFRLGLTPSILLYVRRLGRSTSLPVGRLGLFWCHLEKCRRGSAPARARSQLREAGV